MNLLQDLYRIAGKLQLFSWLLPRENDTIPNPAWQESSRKILIVRLSPSEHVEESLTHGILFTRLRHLLPDAYIDFAFFPSRQDTKVLATHQLPWIFGVRSTCSIDEFDVVLFSCSYVLELVNLVHALQQSGIEPLRTKREIGAPLFILGGASASLAQAAVPFIDGMYAGEFESSESALAKLFSVFDRTSKAAEFLNRYLKQHGAIAGLYVENSLFVPQSAVQANETLKNITPYPLFNNAHADTARLQISLGCPFRCSFCYEGFSRKPYRDVDRELLLVKSQELRVASGVEKLDIVSFNFNTHRHITDLMSGFLQPFAHVHFMSQRLDILDASPALFKAELASGKRSFTLGVEGISERMRVIYRKDLTTSSIVSVLHKLMQAQVREIKLFFIISSYESEHDLHEFRGFVARVLEMNKQGLHTKIKFSFGYLSIMPHTPLQFLPIQLDPEHFSKIYMQIESILSHAGMECRLAFTTASWACAQALMFLQTDRAAQLLQDFTKAGLVFDESMPPQALRIMNQSLFDLIDSNQLLTVAFPHPLAQLYPQAYQEKLLLEFEKIKTFLVNDTLRGDEPTVAAPSPAISATSSELHAIRSIEFLLQQRKKTAHSYILVKIPAHMAGVHAAWLCSWVTRQLIVQLPLDQQASTILKVDDVYHARNDRKGLVVDWYGWCFFRITFHPGKNALPLSQIWPTVSSFIIPSSGPDDDTKPIKEICFSFSMNYSNEQHVKQLILRAFAESHVQATLLNTASGFTCQVSPKIKKKAELKSCLVHLENTTATITLTCAPKHAIKRTVRIIAGQNSTIFIPICCDQFVF